MSKQKGVNSFRDYALLLRAIKEQKDEAVKKIFVQIAKDYRMRILGIFLNSLSLILIIGGYIFISGLNSWLLELHGALTGVFLLGIFNYIYRALNS